jgi:DivIVA domain-containing protein
VAHAPREIRRRTFTLVRRGYDPDEVTQFLDQIAGQLEGLIAAGRQHRYRNLGREVEAVLRTAHDEAARMVAEAKKSAKALKDDAALYALEQRREADQDRDEAKRLLVRGQERSTSIVRESEERAAGIVQTAEALARSRATQILAQAQRRLDRLNRDEQQARQRLHRAQTELQAVIERVGTMPDAVIDLTEARAVAEAPREPAGPSLVIGGDDDPVAEMVRTAVAQAAEHSRREPPPE